MLSEDRPLHGLHRQFKLPKGFRVATIETLKRKIIQILTSRKINYIDFNFDGFSITPYDYSSIAQKINDNKIHIEIKSNDKNIRATYRPFSNTIGLRSTDYGNNPQEETTIVHEATHAIVDMKRSNISWIADETIAYTADAIFRRSKPSYHYATFSKIFDCANVLAERVISNGNNRLKSKDEDVMALIKSIYEDPAYKEKAHIKTNIQLDGIN